MNNNNNKSTAELLIIKLSNMLNDDDSKSLNRGDIKSLINILISTKQNKYWTPKNLKRTQYSSFINEYINISDDDIEENPAKINKIINYVSNKIKLKFGSDFNYNILNPSLTLDSMPLITLKLLESYK